MTAGRPESGAAGLVWLVSYPKSGNTWFRLLRSNLISGQDDPVDINGMIGGGPSVTFRETFDNWTLLESGLLTHAEIDALRPAYSGAVAGAAQNRPWAKIHEKWRLAPNGEPVLGNVRGSAAVYLVRDPRDIAVSFAHHMSADIDETIDCLNSPGYRLGDSRRSQLPHLREELGDWSAHVAGWLDQRCMPVHVVRYEDLKRNTAAQFACALRFLGESFSMEDVERAVRLSAFSELQRQEQANGFRERHSRTAPFFRRGEAGAWRDELTAAQAGRIVEAHAHVMRRLGYLPG